MTGVAAEVEQALAEVDRVAAVAHALLAHPGLHQAERERGLLQLFAGAKRSRVPALACEAVIRQIDASIDGTLHEPPRPLGDGWGRRQRAMRALGYVTCPACGGTIADEETVRRLEGWWSA